jgi:hypothetical protein
MNYKHLPLINVGLSVASFIYQIYYINPQNKELLNKIDKLEMKIKK